MPEADGFAICMDGIVESLPLTPSCTGQFSEKTQVEEAQRLEDCRLECLEENVETPRNKRLEERL